MSKALCVYHGSFGRACLYYLDRPLAMHAHREGHLIVHVAGSEPAMTVSGHPRSLRPLNAVAINPWEPHNFAPTNPRDGHVMLMLYIDPDWFVSNEGNGEMRCKNSEIELTPSLFAQSRRLVDLMRSGNLTDHFDSYLHEFTAESFDRLICTAPTIPFKDGLRIDERVSRSVDLIAHSLNERIDLDEVARRSGLSKAHFFRLFRHHTGLSPNIFRNTLRMERAIDWLIRTDKRVTEIALELGYSSQSSFTRFFALNVGLAPKEYRRAVKLV